MKCQVDIFGDPRNVTLENKKGERGASKVVGSMGPARLSRLVGGLGFWEGPVQRPCLALLPSYPLPAHGVCLNSFHTRASFVSASAPHPDSSVKVYLALTQGALVWAGPEGSLSTFKFQPHQPRDRAPHPPTPPRSQRLPGPRAAETRLSPSQIFICSVALSIRIISYLKGKENTVCVHGCICMRVCARACMPVGVYMCVCRHVCLISLCP